ncbi:undecaprenyldiphospho-muramoylpentapeptide beta-N-acetylglucosaminyltransferase [Schaalia sp. ZJ405]|uniref:undecaprenyldiphospho-muramoylpentapeptide beta-N-acetylglucosaminyltransferase n=1 Tax=Schaalia sp. ZJ405 TaxID=2709403 RepID=UPI0013EC77B2|nr:undecaprenyldiphospho-muramoylpentapeptide beta-N-acetylglucosaminyltransferase [Schaalia sp. ZJ405]QPK81869.1 undecaprenyldiphospho-muramoylpentapeptide beta-N-acetylglucosaminyltransferase [Schaalia sp. ZJ405]
MALRIVLAGGGTAGHVNPLLATATCLAQRDHECTVIGTREGLEADLVPAAGFNLRFIPRVPLPRRPSLQFFSLPGRWSKAVDECVDILTGADVLVGFGGYVSTPAYRAAQKLGIPVVIHEQNARPGLANRLGARFARIVALTFTSTPLSALQGTTHVTGLPLRPAIEKLAKERHTEDGRRAARQLAASELGIVPDAPTILITGGSLGALHINEVMAGLARELPPGVQVLHLTGHGKDEPVRRAVDEAGVGDRWHVFDYVTDMEKVLAVADLVVCRSGAGTVAEMTALGLPCIYVPLPIGNGEQRLNAGDHVAAGGAVLIENPDFTADTARTSVYDLIGSAKLEQMAEVSLSLGRVNAAEDLAKLIELTAKTQEED